MGIDKDLLELLACPLCKSDIKYEDEKLFCTNPQCNCIYSIKEDIPIMLIDEAKRPCPKCNTQRDWLPESDTLKCPKCNETFTWMRNV